MKLVQILNELQGISFDARAWTPIITNAIKLSKNSQSPTIIGKNYPKQYQQFPLDYIHFVVDENFGNGAGYDEKKSGYQNNGEYHVYFAFGPYADVSAINHELKHAFEDFMRISKNSTPLRSTKEANDLFGSGFEEFMMSPGAKDYFFPITFLIEGLYYTSKIERSAFSDSVYDYPEKNGMYEMYIRKLVRFARPDNVLANISEPHAFNEKWIKFNETYPINAVKKFKNYEDFIRWACDEINYKGNKTLKKLGKIRYFSTHHNKEGGK